MKLSFTIPKKRPYKNVLQLKITLLYIKPPVWRKVLIPDSYTFYDLHMAIQNIMGWTDSHLHRFEKRIPNTQYRKLSVEIDCPYAIDEYNQSKHPLYTTEIPVTQYFKKPKDKMIYVYDFGDNWEHSVILEKILPRKPKIKYPMCLGGKLACPPEDCGGTSGYHRCVKTFKDHKDEDLLWWMNDWNPKSFVAQDVNFENPRTRFLKIWE